MNEERKQELRNQGYTYIIIDEKGLTSWSRDFNCPKNVFDLIEDKEYPIEPWSIKK